MITCPNCKSSFALEDVMTDEIKKELRGEMIAYRNKKDQEVLELQTRLGQQVAETEEKVGAAIKAQEADLRRQIEAEGEQQRRFMDERSAEAALKIKSLQEKEIEALRLQHELTELKRNAEIDKRKYLLENSAGLIDEALRKEKESFELEKKEMELKLEQQKRQVDEMKKKLEQGSMQLQGEVQELLLEDILKSAFPFDLVAEVGKGVRGADCVLTVRNNLGQECGKIIYESKRTEHFGGDWIEKLKTDMRSQGAHVAVIVTKTRPRDMELFGEKDGVWICSFSEVRALSHVLRDGIIRIFNASKSQQNRGDKMNLLYDYLTSNEFGEQWKAIREGFLSMKLSIQRERDAMEKLWKSREKQLEKVLLNAAHIRGSVEGIAGKDAVSFNLLDEGTEDWLAE